MSGNFVRLSTMPRMKKSNIPEMFPNFKGDPHRFTYQEARRRYYPLYETLIQEMYEANCRISATIFECLIRQERQMVAAGNLSKLVRDNRELLMPLHRWAIAAEHAAMLGTEEGLIDSLRMLEKMIVLLNEYIEHEWLLHQILTIAVKTCETHDRLTKHNPKNMCSELKAKIYCLEAIYLGRHNLSLNESVEYFTKALDICRGESWKAPDYKRTNLERVCQTLHEYVTVNFAHTLLAYVKYLDYGNLDLALRLSHQAVMVVSEVNTENNMGLLCAAYLRKIKVLIYMLRFSEAMTCIKVIGPHFKKHGKSPEYAEMACELDVVKAKCYIYFKLYPNADTKLKQALHLSRTKELTAVEPKILFVMGQFYINQKNDLPGGRKKYEEAMYAYARKGDKNGHQKTLYALAKMKADHILPELMVLIRRSTNFCHLHRLRRWKNACVPFWSEQSAMQHLFSRSDYSLSHQMSMRSDSDELATSSEWEEDAGNAVFMPRPVSLRTPFDNVLVATESRKTVKRDPLFCLLND